MANDPRMANVLSLGVADADGFRVADGPGVQTDFSEPLSSLG